MSTSPARPRRLPTLASIVIVAALLASVFPAGPIRAAADAPIDEAPNAESWSSFIERAARRHGEPGERAARFLAEHRPPRDAELDPFLLAENLDLALRAREEFPWASSVPESLFLNDVLPYASLDETRERWRPAMYAIAKQIVAGSESATEAAQRLNDQVFDVIGVHYDTGRKAPNQSVFESMKQGRATCTGLSIILVNACRAVGIPARAAGVASWHDKRGNHTWVEIWDGAWRFAGADEYDAQGLDRGWFVNDAAKAVPGDPEFGVWATSFERTGTPVPMVWARGDRSVPAVDVSTRYVRQRAASNLVVRDLRVFETRGGDRVAAFVTARDADGTAFATVRTKAGRADLNDMPSIAFEPGRAITLEIEHDGATRMLEIEPAEASVETLDIAWDELRLTRERAEAALESLWRARVAAIRAERAPELEAETLVLGDRELRLLERTFGDAPEGERRLFISMHGGGGTAARANDQQWRNQIRLYEAEEGIVVAPRAPTNTWNLWHQAHVDGLFDRLIETYVALRGVDPDRVYLMGYSAGGDGVYQLAPRMADRFAAASMMAGHPNESQPPGLRNLPFAIFMGGRDGAYDRNAVAKRWGDALGALRAADPDGYEHRVEIYPEHGHWMNGDDRVAVPWMSTFTRDPWPRRVVWLQDDVVSSRFYWLAVAPEDAVRGRTIVAEVDDNAIRIESEETRRVVLRLRDALVDLDRPVRVEANGEVVFEGIVPRDVNAIARSLDERADPRTAAFALLEVNW